MIKLERADWENARDQAIHVVKQAMIMLEVNQNLLDIAEKNLLKFPKEIEKDPMKKLVG